MRKFCGYFRSSAACPLVSFASYWPTFVELIVKSGLSFGNGSM